MAFAGSSLPATIKSKSSEARCFFEMLGRLGWEDRVVQIVFFVVLGLLRAAVVRTASRHLFKYCQSHRHHAHSLMDIWLKREMYVPLSP